MKPKFELPWTGIYRGVALAATLSSALLACDEGAVNRPGGGPIEPIDESLFTGSVAAVDAGNVALRLPASQAVDAGLLGYRDPLSAPSVATLALASFAGADSCKSCHPQHYAEWQYSAHANSMRDPVFRASIALQRKDLGHTGNDRFCTQCHTTIGTRSGDVSEGFSFEQLDEISLQGVTCEGCHRSAEIERTHNAGHRIDPSAPIQGPFADPKSPHASVRSETLGTAQFCGSCHDVQDPSGLVLESPLAEWTRSPAAAQGKPCQSCHMPTYEGPASALPGMPTRTLHRHTFTGVEAPLGAIAELPPGVAALLHQQSHDLLKSAVSAEVRAKPSSSEALAFEVVVTNLMDAHNFPTGSSFNREFWLHVEVRDAAGALLFVSGEVDGSGDLLDRHHPLGRSFDPQFVRFGAYLEDAAGMLTRMTWLATAVHGEHVLPPLTSESLPYRVALPATAAGPYTVAAELRFRAFAPRILRELGIEHLIPLLQTVQIAKSVLTLPVAP